MKLHKKLVFVCIIIITAVIVVACASLFPPKIDEPQVGDVPPVTEEGVGGELVLTLSEAHANFGDNCIGCHANGAMIPSEKLPNHPLNEAYANCMNCHTVE